MDPNSLELGMNVLLLWKLSFVFHQYSVYCCKLFFLHPFSHRENHFVSMYALSIIICLSLFVCACEANVRVSVPFEIYPIIGIQIHFFLSFLFPLHSISLSFSYTIHSLFELVVFFLLFRFVHFILFHETPVTNRFFVRLSCLCVCVCMYRNV